MSASRLRRDNGKNAAPSGLLGMQALFNAGQKGGFYPVLPNVNLFTTYLGQESANEVGDPVGLLLDASKLSAEKELLLNGVSGTYANSVDSTALQSLNNSIDIDICIAPADATPTGGYAMTAKDQASNRNFAFNLNATGTVTFTVFNTSNGILINSPATAAPSLLTAGEYTYLRARFVWLVSGTLTCDYYESADGDNWTAVGDQITNAASGLDVNTTATNLSIGQKLYSGSENPVDGSIKSMRIYDGDRNSGGTLKLDFNPTRDYVLGSPTMTSSTTGEVYTLEGNARILPEGFHAEQATSGDRPLLGRHPKSGIRNTELLYSEEFDNAVWTESRGTITPNSTSVFAPDGTRTADELVSTAGQTILPTIAQADTWTGTYTLSCYAKANTMDFLYFQPVSASGCLAWFDVANGVEGTSSGGSLVSTSIEAVGDGWYRCSVTSTNPDRLTIAGAETDNSTTVDTGTNSIYLWGAQMEAGAEATPYQRVGAIYDVSEPAIGVDTRRNLLEYTEDFSNAIYVTTNDIITTDVALAPDGTMTADRLSESTDTQEHRFYFTATAYMEYATVYTFSLYVKSAGRNLFQITTAGTALNNAGKRYNVNLADGTVDNDQYGGTITSVGNDWYRVSITMGTAGSGSGSVTCNMITDGADAARPSYEGDGTSGIFVWGAQIDLGYNVTSYQRIHTNIYSLVGDRRNIISASADFSDSYWTASTTTVATDTTTDPDGNITADTFTLTGTDGAMYSPTLAGYDDELTISMYAKPLASDDAYIIYGSVARKAIFDVALGTVTSVVGGTATIESVGNGWYRCTFTPTVTAGARVYFGIEGASSDSLYVWGAQVEEGGEVTSYQEIVGTAFVPSLVNRRNYLSDTEAFDSAIYIKSASSIVANDTISPDGTRTADKLVDTAINTFHYLYESRPTSIGPQTVSVYAKADERSMFFLYINSYVNALAHFDLSDGTLGATSGSYGCTSTITDVGGGWYRCSITATVPSAACVMGLGLAITDGGVSYLGDGVSGMHFWGGQMEVGTFVTEYQAIDTIYTPPQASPSVPCLYSDSINYYMTIPDSKSEFTFMHNGLGGECIAAGRFGLVDDPDDLYTIVGTRTSSSDRGFSFRWDNRTSGGKDKQTLLFIRGDTATTVSVSTPDGSAPTLIPTVVAFRFKDQVGTDALLAINGVAEAVESLTDTPTTMASKENLTFLMDGDAATNGLAGLMHGWCLYEGIFTSDQSSMATQYWADTIGVTL